ncbi:hypothetical protein J6590_005401 [Homalodisca vitripennis]|nr:hypothetical protein J6590_005401 [Homalodisca vitripennis]
MFFVQSTSTTTSECKVERRVRIARTIVVLKLVTPRREAFACEAILNLRDSRVSIPVSGRCIFYQYYRPLTVSTILLTLLDKNLTKASGS